ncbi:MAG: hypothetical protein EA377_01080 [Phycisphaerales bacterium]|nr:MAG: hypothetical protein EA377_01080 [Phycisphaerales bacterium]
MRVLIVIGVVAAGLLVTCFGLFIVTAIYQVMFVAPAEAAARHDYILQSADYERIVEESRLMLRNPDRYPRQPGGSAPEKLPGYIESIDPSWVIIRPGEGVMLMFDGKYGLYATIDDDFDPTDIVGMGAIQVHSGLWYYEYGR